MPSITQADAAARVEAGLRKARDMGVAMNIAIVDQGGNLVQFSRMDGAWLGSIDIAWKKAKTAVFFQMPTSAIGELSQPGGELYGIEHSNDGLITFGGGLPIRDASGELIGGVGVSGGRVHQDVEVAEAVVAAALAPA